MGGAKRGGSSGYSRNLSGSNSGGTRESGQSNPINVASLATSLNNRIRFMTNITEVQLRDEMRAELGSNNVKDITTATVSRGTRSWPAGAYGIAEMKDGSFVTTAPTVSRARTSLGNVVHTIPSSERDYLDIYLPQELYRKKGRG